MISKLAYHQIMKINFCSVTVFYHFLICIASLIAFPFHVFGQRPDESLIPYRKGNKWGYVNSKNEIIIPFQFGDAGVFSNNKAWVKQKKWYRYISTKGKTVSFKGHYFFRISKSIVLKRAFYSKKFTEVENFSNGFARASKNKRFCYLDTARYNHRHRSICGTQTPRYSHWKTYSYNNKFGVIHKAIGHDNLGHSIIVTADSIAPLYDSVKNTESPYFVAKRNGYWGLLNPKGKELTPFKFSFMNYYEHSHCAIMKEGMFYGMIAENGNYLVLPKYDHIAGFITGEHNSPSHFSKVKVNDRYGFIDKYGKEISLIKYDLVEDFECGLSRVKVNNQFGYIDTYGKEYFEE